MKLTFSRLTRHWIEGAQEMPKDLGCGADVLHYSNTMAESINR